MCEKAMAHDCGKSLAEALPSDHLLSDAVHASNVAVRGLREVNFQFDVTECKMLRCELKRRKQMIPDEIEHRWKYIEYLEAVERFDSSELSQKLALEVYALCLTFNLPAEAAIQITFFVEAKPGSLQNNTPRKHITKGMDSLLSSSYYQRQLSKHSNDNRELGSCAEQQQLKVVLLRWQPFKESLTEFRSLV